MKSIPTTKKGVTRQEIMMRRVRLESNVIVALGLRHKRYTSTKSELGLAEDMTTVFLLSCIYSYIKGMEWVYYLHIQIFNKWRSMFLLLGESRVNHSLSPKKGTVCEEIVIVPYDNTTNYRVIHIYIYIQKHKYFLYTYIYIHIYM